MINFGTPATKGGNGSGITGLVQGMQMAKQESLADDKNAMLKEQLDMTKKNFEFADLQRRGEKLNKLVFSAEKSGKWNSVNDFLADPANKYFGGGSINVLDHNQAPRDGDGKLQNLFVNKYRDDTGKDYSDQNPLMTYTSKDEGARFFTPDTFAVGSGYGKYRRDAQLAEDVLEASIAKKIADAKGDPVEASYASLKAKKDSGQPLDTTEQATFDQLERKANLTKNNAINELIDTDFKVGFEKAVGGNLGEEYDNALRLETIAEQKYKNDDLDTDINAYNNLNQTYIDIQDLVKKGVKSGVTESMELESAKLAKDWKDMSRAKKKEALNSIIMRSKAGGALANLLKEISGSAVAEDEFIRQMDNIFGGDIKKINPEVLLTALGASVDVVKQRADKGVNDIKKLYPASKMERQAKMHRGANVKPSGYTADKVIGKAVPGAYKTTREVGIEGVGDEAQSMIDFGASGLKSIFNRVLKGDATEEEEKSLAAQFEDFVMGKDYSKKNNSSANNKGGSTNSKTNIPQIDADEKLINSLDGYGPEGKAFKKRLLVQIKKGDYKTAAEIEKVINVFKTMNGGSAGSSQYGGL